MKIITNTEQLVGQQLTFVHVAPYGEYATFVTEKGEIFMMHYKKDRVNQTIRPEILYPASVMNVLKENRWLANELGELGVLDLEQYEKERRLEQKKEAQKAQKQKHAKEYAEYLRLKEKFEREEENL